MATVVGWGLHKDPGGVPFEELQEVDLRILSLDACFVVHFPDFDKTTQICAGGQGRSPCAVSAFNVSSVYVLTHFIKKIIHKKFLIS
ncbi:UNVERIFIED_CONTAM: hypothetical protein NCL1_39910 [Trichonephila clavipes]